MTQYLFFSSVFHQQVCRKQIGPRLRCFSQRTFETPLANLFVVPAEQYLGDLPAAELRWPCILWTIEHLQLSRSLKALASGVAALLPNPVFHLQDTVRFVHRRVRIADHAGHQPRHAIDDHCRSQFAAAQHKIPDRNLIVHQMVGYSRVHAFIASAQQHHPVNSLTPLPRQPLIVRSPRCRNHHYFGTLTPRRQNLFHRLKQRLTFQQHSFATTKRPIIDRTVFVRGPTAQIVDS